MKKILALTLALVFVLSLAACGGGGTTSVSTADEVKPLDSYSKDFDGLKSYLYDFNGVKRYEDKNGNNRAVIDVYYDMLGADNGVRYVLNDNAYVEIYDFSKADNATAKAILEDVKDDGVFKPVPDGANLTAAITDSGKYVLAWDATRNYDYQKNVATDTVISNW